MKHSRNTQFASSRDEIESLRQRVAELESANAALEAREERYRNLIEHAQDMIWMVDLTGAVTFLNSACQTITGYTKQELLGKSLSDIIAPENLESTRLALTRKWDAGQSTHYEIQIVAKNGAPTDLEVNSALLMRAGRPAGVLAIARDVTERKQAQEALRQSAEKFEFLFANHPMPMWVFDIETLRFLEVNQAAVEKYGYSREEFLAMSVTSMPPPGQEQRFRTYFGEVNSACHGSGGHWRHLTKSGRIIDTEIFSRAMTFAGRDAVLSVIQDITGRKLLEEQLHRSNKLEAVGRLAGGVAHDFNNLLTVITGYSQLLLNRINPEHPMYAGLDQIRHSADRAAILTRQLMAFSRRQTLQPGILDLNIVVRDMEKMLRRLIGEHIELVTKLSPDLGRIQADASQIEQIVVSLALNSRDAMPNGGTILLETATVVFQTRAAAAGHRPGSYAMLSVTDTGVGMDEHIRRHLFEPFFTTKEHGEGAGLGLSAVYGMVELHGGFIQVASELGEGARFEVYLPNIPDPADTSVYDTVGIGGSETILVVEDEVGVLRLIGETLRGYGYKVIECPDSVEALEMARQESSHVDLLLTDVVMPKVSGPGLADAWKLLWPELKVLFISGYRDDPSAGQLFAGIERELLQKPFSGVRLAQKIREILDGPTD